MKRKIILASTSPRRKKIAQQMGLEFRIVKFNYKEEMDLDLPPEELAKHLAHGKAAEVAKSEKKGIILGLDTFVVLDNKKIGKPKSMNDAYAILKAMSGKTVKIYSGVALIDAESKKEITDVEISEVVFRDMTEYEIKSYIATGEPLDKAGAFGIQELGSIFIKKINGCYFNVVGFPVYNIYKNLTRLGVNIFEFRRWKKRN